MSTEEAGVAAAATGTAKARLEPEIPSAYMIRRVLEQVETHPLALQATILTTCLKIVKGEY